MNDVNRLPFFVGDFTRVMWVSDSARECWAPRFARIARAWRHIEVESVGCGVRRCAIVFVTPELFVEETQAYLLGGLHAVALELHAAHGQSYSSATMPPSAGESYAFRLAVGDAEATSQFLAAYLSGDDETIGHLLGFPTCCTAFFRETWVTKKLKDSTWPMAVRTSQPLAHTVEIAPAKEANILWRWLGLRAVPHLPCSFTCEGTAALGSKLLQVGRDIGFVEEMDWLDELLSWPIEWSGLHGLAELRTPVLKLLTSTDATSEKITVRLLGDRSPVQSARGVRFPYQPNGKKARPVNLTTVEEDAALAGYNDAPHLLNGFSSQRAMYEAHKPLLNLIKRLADSLSYPGDILDLGCGDGSLLVSVCSILPLSVPMGVELDAHRANVARDRLIPIDGGVVVANLFDIIAWSKNGRFKLAIVCIDRFFDVELKRSALLVETLCQRCDHILIYSYDALPTPIGGSNIRKRAEHVGFPQSYWQILGNAAIIRIQSRSGP